jgi:hypothetical protein
MAKKARKKSAAKSNKKSKAVKKKTKVRAAAKKKKSARKAKRKTIGDRLSNAYHTVVDTMKGTDRLRNKLEAPGTSETE